MTTAIGPTWMPPAQPHPAQDRGAASARPDADAPLHEGATPIAPNPSLRIEPSLGLVVFELRDGAGQVTRSVPTERELRAYRTAALRGEGAPAPAAEADQTRNPPGGIPSSASALDVPAVAPKGPAPPSEARLTR